MTNANTAGTLAIICITKTTQKLTILTKTLSFFANRAILQNMKKTDWTHEGRMKSEIMIAKKAGVALFALRLTGKDKSKGGNDHEI